MDPKAFVTAFWRDVAAQDRQALEAYFAPGAAVFWHNTNERFSAEEYIRANCEYPGEWRGEVERVELAGEAAISVVRVWLDDDSASFHAVSFFTFTGGVISRLDEYWGDDGEAPEWRRKLGLGSAIG